MAKKDEEGLDFDDTVEDTDGDETFSFDFSDTHEEHILDEGEHQLRITSARTGKKEETGNTYFLLYLESVNDPYSKDIVHTLMRPESVDGEKAKNRRKLILQEFFEAVGVDPASFSLSSLIGETVWAILTIAEDDPQYGVQNKVKRFVVSS